MANITASDVNKLRKQTGSGMMDCKNALVEANGDFDAAIDILRKKGQKVAAKRGDREAAEGLAIAKINADGSKGVVVMVNCETDFVAKNEEFITFVSTIVEAALTHNPSSIEELNNSSYAGNGMTVAEKILEQVGKIGEKIEISVYNTIEAGKVIAYNHPGNQIASLIGLSKDGDFAEAGRDVAMQVAAMAPIALNEAAVDQATIDKEIEIGKDQAIAEGKPADLAEKISKGRLNKFFKENTLVNQAFIEDNKKSVGQYLKDIDSDLAVTDFKRAALA
ncbi:MAG: elongation factor Ts [Flavobacteriales bacterium]|nr:elongation factor Ts [Flavobacteriales bacterium]